MQNFVINVTFGYVFQKVPLLKSLTMNSGLDKYRAEILKVSGFAFLTPFAKAILDLISLSKQFNVLGFIIYFVVCFALGTLGTKFILRGYDILDKK